MTKMYAQVTPPSEFIAALLMRIALQIFQKQTNTQKPYCLSINSNGIYMSSYT